eukprot:860894-Prymnesium_polylepis.1
MVAHPRLATCRSLSMPPSAKEGGGRTSGPMWTRELERLAAAQRERHECGGSHNGRVEVRSGDIIRGVSGERDRSTPHSSHGAGADCGSSILGRAHDAAPALHDQTGADGLGQALLHQRWLFCIVGGGGRTGRRA